MSRGDFLTQLGKAGGELCYNLCSMLYLYGDESNTPGADPIWAIGFLFTPEPKKHVRELRRIRKQCSYVNRELKFSSTDYSQVLCAIRLIDYFLESENLYFKIIIKNNLYFNKEYFKSNAYKLKNDDMAYISAYTELCKSIRPDQYNQHKKLLNLDHKPFKGNVILPKFIKKKDESVVAVYRRDSARRNNKDKFTGVSEMLQLCDFLTGLVLSVADVYRQESPSEKSEKNIYRKTVLSKCRGLKTKLLKKENYYWPSFTKQKINIFYWKSKKRLAS